MTSVFYLQQRYRPEDDRRWLRVSGLKTSVASSSTSLSEKM